MTLVRWPLVVLVLAAIAIPAAPASTAPAVGEPPMEFVLTSRDSFISAEAWEALNEYLESGGAEAEEAAGEGQFQSVFTEGGFTTFGERSYGDYTIRLVTSTQGDIEEYRDEVQQLVNEINAANGVSMQLALEQIPAPPLTQYGWPNLGQAAATGDIVVMITSASPCGTMNGTTGILGCGGPTGGAVVDGIFRWTEGAVYIRPGIVSDLTRQVVTSHEIGHALGLDHFNGFFEGSYQLMRSVVVDDEELKSGDLNGVHWLSNTPPSNDSPAGAAAVCPGDSSVSASTWFATKDAGEAAHAGVAARRSVWYRYQPRAEQDGGLATINTANDGVDDFDTVLAVYRGVTPTTPVVSDDDGGPGDLSLVSFTIDAAETYWVAVDGFGFARGETDVVFDLPALTSSMVPLCAPARVLDTRPSGQTIDAQHQATGYIGPGAAYTLPIAGRAGVPADAVSVVLNVTAVSPLSGGYVTVYPCGALPNASNLNFVVGDVIPNSVLARVDALGNVCFFSSTNTHLLVDVGGYFRDTDALTPLPTPGRLLDTRIGGQTIDMQHAAEGQLTANVPYELPVVNRAGVPASPASVVLNVTAVQPIAGGYLTIYPCGEAPPNASNLNFLAGNIIPNMVLARVGAGGKVCLISSTTTDVLVDVSGYFATSTFLVPLSAPQRVLDTRTPTGTTADGQHQAVGRIAAGGTYQLPIAGRVGVPNGVASVALNVTAVTPNGAGYLTVFACGQDLPNASSLNFSAGEVIPNSVLASIGTGGKVCFFSSVETDLLVDVSGYFP